jgi:cell division septation protein DedD
MANFTQLHLSNNSQKSDKNIKDIFATEKFLFGTGVLAIAVISGILLLVTDGCSKSSKSAAMNSEPTSPITQNAIVPSPASAIAAAQPPAVTPKPAKKRVQRKAPMTTYTEPAYGVSFRYPKNYALKTGDEPQRDFAGLGPIQTDFIEPGAVTVAALELPRASYPGTDFTSGFFSVSVNSAISQEQCELFAFPKVEHPENDPGAVSKVKIAGKEYAMVEGFGNAGKNDPHTKYFHHFENGSCYEFGMGLNTTDADIAGLKPVNRSLVFGRLEQILASVKLQPVEKPQVAKASEGKLSEVAKASETKPSEVAKTQEAKPAETKASDTKTPEVVKDAPANPMPENNQQ